MNKKKPTFFIVTPSYNQAHFLKQTIESVLRQPEISLHYAVMDGGSTDRTLFVLRSYKRKLHWKSEKDKGQTDAINKGLRSFQNKTFSKNQSFFGYLNSDDYYLPNTFQTVAAAFAAHPSAQWLVGDCRIVDGHNQSIHMPVRIYKKLLRSIFQPWFLFVTNPFPQPAVFVRWEAMKKIGKLNDSLQYVMDYELWLRLQKKFGAPLFIPQTLAAFRIHGASKGGSQFQKQFAEELIVAKKFTSSPLFFFLHQLHNWLIISIYDSIK